MAKLLKKGKSPRGARGAPEFNEKALTALTSKIDEKLGSGDHYHKRKNPPTDASEKPKQKRQRNLDARDSRSEAKSEAKSEATQDRDALLAEIKALGGDEEDLDLIDGVESSDEAYAEKSKQAVDKKLKSELLALSKELGFAELTVADEEEEVDNEEEEEDDDDDEQTEEELKEKGAGDDKDDGAMRRVEGLMFEPRANWHSVKLAKLPDPVTDDIGPYMAAISALKQHAKSLLDADAEKYRTTVFASTSHKFLATIMTSGTLTDKVSALTLACQESPAHNIRAFETLMNLGSKKSRAQAIGAIGALVDMLGRGTLLPSDRRLRTFQMQPNLLGTLQRSSVKAWAPGQALPGKLTEAHLICWVYEDWLKETYFKMIQLLEVWCSDEIEYSRMRAIDFVYALLKDKPEQESNLLTLLVNKLGDRDRKISSRASYLLLQLQISHPGMKPIIIHMVEQTILVRSSQDHRAKYCAINTLNQTILTSKEPAVAESLLRIYFDLFVTMLKTGKLGVQVNTALDKEQDEDKGKSKGQRTMRPKRGHDKPATTTPSAPETEAADKLVSALLTGVNRAAPFVGANDTIIEEHLDTLFKITHSANFNTSIQALLLIQHLSTARHMASDRFYRTLYESLLDPRLVTSSKQALYLNLLLRALKNDVDVRRVKAFAKRMLQVAGLHQPPFICGLLYVISHLRQTFPDLSTLVEVPEETEFDDDSPEGRPTYDGRKRHPESSNAHRSCMWEIIPAQSHFHPTVSKFASALLDRNQKMAKPDLESHGLIRFLDKFVYRNPKSTDSARGASIMQPLRASKDLGDIWLGAGGAQSSGTKVVNTAAFWNKKVEDVAAEDVFFHEYFQHVSKEPKASAARAKAKSAAAADEDDEEADEDEIWKALVSTQPDVEGEGSGVDFDDDDDDEDDVELDEADMASDDEGDESPVLDLDSDLDDDDDGEGSDGLVAPEVDESEAEEGKKSKREDERKSRRKMLRGLPTFASVDDYAELLAGEEEM